MRGLAPSLRPSFEAALRAAAQDDGGV